MVRSANYLWQEVFESLQALRRLHQQSASLATLEDSIRHAGLMEHLFPNWVILGFNIEKSRPDYLSDNSRQLLRLSGQERMAFSADDFFACIHPEDVEYVLEVLNKVHYFLRIHQQGPLVEYRFVTSYRFRKAHGQYIHLFCEKTTYQGHLFMMLLKDISAERPFTHVRLDIYKHTPEGCVKIEEYIPAQGKGITRREAEIIQLIKQGFSSKEIADRLSISLHTVRNHRSRLFEKTNSKNVIELLNFAASEQII